MDIDFATIIKYILSILIGFSCVVGSVVWSNYDKFDDPPSRRKQIIIGFLMIAFGLSIATGYHYAREYNYIPEFMQKSEGQKADERAREENKKKAEAKKALEDNNQKKAIENEPNVVTQDKDEIKK